MSHDAVQAFPLQALESCLQANAVHLSAGLPHIAGGTQKVLYPSSAKAGSDLQVVKLAYGFRV